MICHGVMAHMMNSMIIASSFVHTLNGVGKILTGGTVIFDGKGAIR